MFIAQTRVIRGATRREVARFTGIVRDRAAALDAAQIGRSQHDQFDGLIYDLRYGSHTLTHGITDHEGAEGPYQVLHLTVGFWPDGVARDAGGEPPLHESFSFTLPMCKPASSPSAFIEHVIRTQVTGYSLRGRLGDLRDRERVAGASMRPGHALLEHAEVRPYRQRTDDLDDTEDDDVPQGQMRSLAEREERQRNRRALRTTTRAVRTPRAPLLRNPETGE